MMSGVEGMAKFGANKLKSYTTRKGMEGLVKNTGKNFVKAAKDNIISGVTNPLNWIDPEVGLVNIASGIAMDTAIGTASDEMQDWKQH